MDLSAELATLRQRIIARLEQALPDESVPPKRLHQAMRHGALVPGKCVRGGLVYAAGRTLGIEVAQLDRLACAVELVHAHSLVHDDLPCMDDDDLRRGRPSCHAAYGEATAMLAGNSLLLHAILEISDDPNLTGVQQARAVSRLCRAAGSLGLTGGQQLDIEMERAQGCQLDDLNEVYRMKTGCLIHTSVMLPTELVSSEDARHEALDTYGWKIGLAFQIRDDLEDQEQDQLLAGSADAEHTYPTVLGTEASRQRLAELGADALAALESFGEEADFLRELAQALTCRATSQAFQTQP